MCKLNNIKDKKFLVYRIVKDNYVGITSDLHKRLLKHRSRSKFDITEVNILESGFDLENMLKLELYWQTFFKCKEGVRNQEGVKNPSAKLVLHYPTGIYYDTIKEACISLDYNYINVRAVIKNKNNKYKLIKV